MTSAYDLLRQRCGLSQQEAADFHKTRLDTVKSWCSDRRHAPDGVIAELRDLYKRIDIAADHLVTMADNTEADVEIEFGLSADDAEAQSIGWPCVGAHAATLGLAIALIRNPVTIVPLGSTVAGTAVADALERKISQ